MRVLCIRHGDGPEDDRVTSWCRLNGVRPDIRRPFRGEETGDLTDDLAAVVVFGGMYNAYDMERHPFLKEEYRMIEAAMAADLPLLGICQGAQMIAHALGAWVGPMPDRRHEFGYYLVTPTQDGRAFLPNALHMCQAHYHTYDLPAGARHLARSDLFEHQAFQVGGTTFGFQFHAEQAIEGFRRWRATFDDYDAPGVQSREEQSRRMHAHDAAQAEWFYGFMDRFCGSSVP